MKSVVSFVICSLLAGGVSAQLNVQFLSQLDYEPILNDIWGYVDENGTEYALVGMTSGTSIVSLEDPANPQEVLFIDGTSSIWRDIKTWGDFAYVTADQGQQGLLIIDLSPLPQDTPVYAFWRPEFPGIGFYNRSHNIWIDEFGRAYLAGSNTGGTTVIDVSGDPWNPVFLNNMPYEYAHDIYVRNNIAYASEIYIGQVRSYDVSDIMNIQLLGSATTPYSFTHNAWLSDDGNSIFTTDERANAFIGSFDVSDPTEIKEIDRFRPARTVGLNVIPHNVHVKDDYVIISYYTDGCIIVDGSRPDNLIEVGNWDTYPEEHGGFNGAWGAYPFLPSGIVLMSDRQHGLFVLAPDYKRGCYLEGDVKDAASLMPISHVKVEILLEAGDDSEVLIPEMTDPQGIFKTGKAVAGNYTVRVSHPDYITQEIQGIFQNGEVLELHILLERKPSSSVSGNVVRSADVTTVPFAYVILQSGDRYYETQADANGNYSFNQIINDTYDVLAVNWGNFGISQLSVEHALNMPLVVQSGYYDDFAVDLGWTVTSESQGSVWERGEPLSELLFGAYRCNPDGDLNDDFGTHAFVTGNNGGNPEEDDVEDGYTMLSSPLMDLSAHNEPLLTYRPWLCQRFPDQNVFFVRVSNGTDTVTIDTVKSFEIEGEWQMPSAINLSEVLPVSDQMQVHFYVTDNFDPDNVIKAGLDMFQVIDGNPSASTDIPQIDFTVYPNPASGAISVIIDAQTGIEFVQIVDMFGRTVVRQAFEGKEIGVHIDVPGLYVVQLLDKERVVGQEKVVIVKD